MTVCPRTGDTDSGPEVLAPLQKTIAKRKHELERAGHSPDINTLQWRDRRLG